jgi:hypothetical protein
VRRYMLYLRHRVTKNDWTLRAAAIVEFSLCVAYVALTTWYLANAQSTLHPARPQFETGLEQVGASIYVGIFPFVISWAVCPILAGLLMLSRRLRLLSLISAALFVMPFVVCWSVLLVNLGPVEFRPALFWLAQFPIWIAGISLAAIPVVVIRWSKQQFREPHSWQATSAKKG